MRTLIRPYASKCCGRNGEGEDPFGMVISSIAVAGSGKVGVDNQSASAAEAEESPMMKRLLSLLEKGGEEEEEEESEEAPPRPGEGHDTGDVEALGIGRTPHERPVRPCRSTHEECCLFGPPSIPASADADVNRLPEKLKTRL